MMHDLAWWVLHVLGVDNLGVPWYGFWSGIAGDTALFAIGVAAATWFSKHHGAVTRHNAEHRRLLNEQNALLRRQIQQAEERKRWWVCRPIRPQPFRSAPTPPP